MRVRSVLFSRLAITLTVAAPLGLAAADSAQAGNLFGNVVNGFAHSLGHALGVPTYRPRPSYNQPTYRSTTPSSPGAYNPNPPSAADSNRALASLAPPTTDQQKAILKSLTPSQALGAVGANNDLEQIGKDENAEANRDYTTKIDALIDRIKKAQNAQHSTKEGDVTQHAILESLNNAIREANLQKFETFLGENWSPERLRVMILDRASNEIGGLFDGTNRGAVTMNDLDLIIRKAGRNVYARLFETSELLAANRGSTLFVQRLYQTHGDLVSGEVRESAEQLLAEASTAGIQEVAPLLRRDPNAFALRYRAERIIYDCLTDNIETISSSESGMASPAEINSRVLKVDKDQCAKWVASQLIGADGKLKAQDPLPLRVVWTPDGPRDDASMYGRASDQL